MGPKDHWDDIYSTRPVDKLGWYEPHLRTSLEWIQALALPLDAPIIDVGGGVSTLADDLLDLGYASITVLDLSESALAVIKGRLAEKAGQVTWVVGDITAADLPAGQYELWHDRAVFHFLTAAGQQQKYRANLLKALRPGGHLIIGTFAPEAPPKCSGLPVERYTPDRLEDWLGSEFELMRRHKELHITPGGVEQMYLYCHFRRAGARRAAVLESFPLQPITPFSK
jgi:SAM-dependent methyltransferase